MELLFVERTVYRYKAYYDKMRKKENADLREELEYYRNRKLSGRRKHNAKWMAIYQYKAYYDKVREVEDNE